jgi:hypothetical protein
LETTTTARDIFKFVSDFFEGHSMEWENLSAICMDGAHTMFGCISGFQALIKTVAPNATGTHCVIHRQVVAARNFTTRCETIMTLVIQ